MIGRYSCGDNSNWGGEGGERGEGEREGGGGEGTVLIKESNVCGYCILDTRVGIWRGSVPEDSPETP